MVEENCITPSVKVKFLGEKEVSALYRDKGSKFSEYIFAINQTYMIGTSIPGTKLCVYLPKVPS